MRLIRSGVKVRNSNRENSASHETNEDKEAYQIATLFSSRNGLFQNVPVDSGCKVHISPKVDCQASKATRNDQKKIDSLSLNSKHITNVSFAIRKKCRIFNNFKKSHHSKSQTVQTIELFFMMFCSHFSQHILVTSSEEEFVWKEIVYDVVVYFTRGRTVSVN